VTFASAQTVRNYVELGGRRIPAACIGPVTAKAARALGFKVVVRPSRYTIPDLVQAIVAYRKRS
jgi:uroporphyrinogen III methyltransferase/synthase